MITIEQPVDMSKEQFMYMGPEFRVWIKFINLKVAHIKASTENHETG